ncbi:MAG TPA: DnaJ C-terminal domain-containing protein [Polyangiaceae bacterium]|nr:DnaJ C-terminal domain-containing protein [Polyangiaceae bacterium]
MATDLYADLGVPRGASQDEIKKAYRKLAAQFHPDRNPHDKSAEERFKAVNRAHQVLGDADKRALYDEFGEVALREGFDAEAARAYGRARSRAGGRGASSGGFSFEDILGNGNFGDLFGEMFRGGGARNVRPRSGRGADVTTEVSVDLLSAIKGTQILVHLPDHLSASAGSSGAPGREIQVRIPPGAGDGDKVRVPAHGAPGSGGAPAGDLVITVRVKKHPHFERDGLDLKLDLPLTPGEAFEGAKVSVPTPDGEVTLKVPKGTQSGQLTRLRGKGVQRKDKVGDLYVRFLVRLPTHPSKAISKAIAELDEALLAERPIREGLRL